MGRPVAFRAAAIKGYPGGYQPLHFRTKEVQEAAWGLRSNLLPPHEETEAQQRCFPLYPMSQTLPR